jgi:mannose-6-phosphate isomerase-like protein (cupin superfamily)
LETVKVFKPASEFFTEEGCYITELHNSADDAGCSVARARLEPGKTTELHCLQDIVERYVIISGNGEVEIERQAPQRVAAMDVVIIPAAASQRITNSGDTDLVFLCICTPRFEPEKYRQLTTAG